MPSQIRSTRVTAVTTQRTKDLAKERFQGKSYSWWRFVNTWKVRAVCWWHEKVAWKGTINSGEWATMITLEKTLERNPRCSTKTTTAEVCLVFIIIIIIIIIIIVIIIIIIILLNFCWIVILFWESKS